jgi:hypothetical protein
MKRWTWRLMVAVIAVVSTVVVMLTIDIGRISIGGVSLVTLAENRRRSETADAHRSPQGIYHPGKFVLGTCHRGADAGIAAVFQRETHHGQLRGGRSSGGSCTSTSR